MWFLISCLSSFRPQSGLPPSSCECNMHVVAAFPSFCPIITHSLLSPNIGEYWTPWMLISVLWPPSGCLPIPSGQYTAYGQSFFPPSSLQNFWASWCDPPLQPCFVSSQIGDMPLVMPWCWFIVSGFSQHMTCCFNSVFDPSVDQGGSGLVCSESYGMHVLEASPSSVPIIT